MKEIDGIMFPETGDDLMAMAKEIFDTMPEWWQMDPTITAMGAEARFDYADDEPSMSARLTRCYELAGKTFLNYEPKSDSTNPMWLIHGTWHGPKAPERIPHAWVVLTDGRIWEPITACIYHAETFMAYTRAEVVTGYTSRQARIKMVDTNHYGPWTGER